MAQGCQCRIVGGSSSFHMMARMNINDNLEEKETKMIFLTEMLLVLYLWIALKFLFHKIIHRHHQNHHQPMYQQSYKVFAAQNTAAKIGAVLSMCALLCTAQCAVIPINVQRLFFAIIKQRLCPTDVIFFINMQHLPQ